MSEQTLEKVASIMGCDCDIPARTIKVDKKEKGLYERTENSTILITEDNKMLLND